jgi:hypothetical protein
MSIASVSDLQVRSGTPGDATPKALINSLAAWIPSEAVAGYVAVQAVLPAIRRTDGQQLCDAANFGPRWTLFWVMLGFTLLLTTVYYHVKVRTSSTPVDSSWLPKRGLLLSGVAFALWAFALPSSPFQDWCGVETWQRTLAIVVGTGVLGGLGLLWHISPLGGGGGGGGGGGTEVAGPVDGTGTSPASVPVGMAAGATRASEREA